MNELIPRNANIAQGLQENAGHTGGGGEPILKLDRNTGQMCYGMEQDPLMPEDHVMLVPASLQHGYVCWKDSQPVDSVMVPMWEPVPEIDTTRHGPFKGQMEGWSPCNGCVFKMEDGTVLRYAPTSLGGRQMIAALGKEFSLALQSEAPAVVPVLSLSSDSYQHKTYGTTHKPVYEVIKWLEPSEAELWGTGGAPRLENTVEDVAESPSAGGLLW